MSIELKKNVVFVHIPKAGGTSIRSFIGKQVDSKYIFPEKNLHQFPRYENLETNGPMLFMSHLSYDFVNDANADAFVLLRHPIERLLSLYSYVMFPGNNVPLIGARYIKPMSLTEFLSSERPEIRMNVDNAQIWQIASGYSARHRELRLKNGATLQRIAHQAKKNLEKAAVVGVLENVGHFYEGIMNYFGTEASSVVKPERKNVSLRRLLWDELSDSEKKLVEGCVTEEWGLYEKAQKSMMAASVG